MKWNDTSRIEAVAKVVAMVIFIIWLFVLILSFGVVGIILLIVIGISIWYFTTAPAREEKRMLREHEARERAEEIVRENERKTLLLKQEKENEYAKRRLLRAEIERMPKYSNWRSFIFERCGRRCEMCGSTLWLEVHHRSSFDAILKSCQINTIEQAFECDALWDFNNGSVLCKQCHEKMESSRYRELMKGS